MRMEDGERQYREWLIAKIEDVVGLLGGDEGQGIHCLNTYSLERLYTAIKHSSPNEDYKGCVVQLEEPDNKALPQVSGRTSNLLQGR